MDWYEDEVRRIEQERFKLSYDPETIFYGSSSMRLWSSLYDDLPQMKPVNLGFGGSTLAACVWFFDRVMAPYHPKKLVLYAGDNDLGDGRSPEDVLYSFKHLAEKVSERFGVLPCYFISLKPSPSRWYMVDRFRYTNELVKNEIEEHRPEWQFIDLFSKMLDASGNPEKSLYVEDGLHLSGNGYKLWENVIKEVNYIQA